jgi:hypothetical protein
MVTYGTHPGMVAPITGNVPAHGDAVFEKALATWASGRRAIADVPVQQRVRRQLHQRPPSDLRKPRACCAATSSRRA